MSNSINAIFLRETALYVEGYMKAHLPEHIVFHNYKRTIKVVRVSDSLGIQSDLGEKERILLHLAAWFTDIGYCSDPRNNSAAGAELAKYFYNQKGVDAESVKLITESINSVRHPQQPTTLVAQILCDAEMYYLGSSNYLQNIELLRKELSYVESREINEEEWLKEQLQILEDHIFFTPAAKQFFKKGKKQNIRILQSQIARLEAHKNEPDMAQLNPFNEETEEEFKPERGVETLFRVTARKQQDLANMADNKANLIISINAIIISVVLSVLATKLEDNPHLIIPTLSIILTSVVTIIIAILATRPKIIPVEDQITPKNNAEFNILFFGHFTRMTLDAYKKTIRKTIMKRDDLYDSISKDIYYQGVVLSRKYRYIAWAYNVFMVGLVASICAFIIAFIFLK